jgi:hypothetical protein
LLTGKPAFEFTNMKDTYKRILKLQYNLGTGMSKEGQDFIKRILVADPNKRLNHRKEIFYLLPPSGEFYLYLRKNIFIK